MFEEEFKIMILHLVQQFEESIPTYYYIVKTAGLIFITLFMLVLSFDVYCIFKKNAVIKMPSVVSVSMGIILLLGYFGLTYELPSLPIYYGWHAAEIAYPNEQEKNYRSQSVFNNSMDIEKICCVFKADDYLAAKQLGIERYAVATAKYLALITALEREKNGLQNGSLSQAEL